MLQGINRVGRSRVGRAIVTVMFGFLIVSFAIWGIGDIFRGASRTQVASVGGTDVTADAFRNAYQTEYQSLIRRARRSITPDQARALGLESRVLSRLVAEASFDREVRDLGLAISDGLVVRMIQADPSFKGPSGTFDRTRFAQLLRDNGLGEAQYVRDQRSVASRQLIAEGVTGGLKVPLAMREAVHRYQTERRRAEYLRLGPAILGTMPPATDADLSAFYEERKTSFRAPEYRTLRLVRLDAAALARPEAVSDEDARAFYGRVKDARFGRPERRTLQQILFTTRAEAEAAAARIAGGISFADLARERGIDQATLVLGTLGRGDVLDPKVAEAAFALPSAGITPPVETPFGTALVAVTAIEPGSLKPYEDVVAEVKGELARERARGEVEAARDAVEDERAGAKPLEAIARDRKLGLVTVGPVDRNGSGKDGRPVPGVPEREQLLAAAFRSEIGQDADPVPLGGGGYVWYEIAGTEPSRERPLAEVRDQVAEERRKSEVSRGLADRARDLVERLDKGETFAAVAAELGILVAVASDVQRGQAAGDLPAAAATRIFATPVGKAASATIDDESRILFRVTGATVPPFVTTTQDSIATEGQLRTFLADDLLTEYVTDLQKRLGVQYYPANVRRAIGGEG